MSEIFRRQLEQVEEISNGTILYGSDCEAMKAVLANRAAFREATALLLGLLSRHVIIRNDIRNWAIEVLQNADRKEQEVDDFLRTLIAAEQEQPR